jgi:DNA mismatch repair protein MutS
MELDNTTYNDLSVFQHEEEFSIFHRLCFTRTSQGRDWLLKYFSNPFSDLRPILDTQQIVRSIIAHIDDWPNEISNGTLMVIEKFYDSNVDAIPNANIVQALSYKLFSGGDFSLVRYSISHFSSPCNRPHEQTGIARIKAA